MCEDRDVILERLYRQHYRSVFRYCAAYVRYDAGYQELVEECVQDAFVKAVTHYADFQDYDNPAGWIALTARNQLRDIIKKKHNRYKALTIYVEQVRGLSSPPATPLDEMINQEEIISKLCDIYYSLTEIEKTIFHAYFLEGKSIKDTSLATGFSFNKVRSGVNRIRKRARKYKNSCFFI